MKVAPSYMELIFEWDANKARRNLKKHRVSFEEAKYENSKAWSLVAEHLNFTNAEKFMWIGKIGS